MHRDVVHGERAIARDHHDAFQHGFVAQRTRLGDDVDFRLGQFGARSPVGDRRLDRGDTVERQRAAHRDHEIDEQRRPDRARAHALDRDHAGDPCRRSREMRAAGAFGRGVGESFDGAASEPPARDRE